MLRKEKNKSYRILVFVIGVIASVTVLSPIIWIILTSFKDVKEIYTVPLTIWPRKFVWTNYLTVVEGLPEFPTYFFNSIKVTIGTLLLVLPASAAAGYALGRREFPGKAIINLFIIAILAIPFLVFLIPLYIIEDILNMLDTNIGLILPYAALNLPLGILVMQASYREIPSELEDSARIDGANAFQTWFQIMTPLVITGLAASPFWRPFASCAAMLVVRM